MNSFVYPLKNLAVFEDMKKDLSKPGKPVLVTGCVEQQKAHLVFGVCDSPVRLIITHNEIRAKQLYEEYRFFDKDVVYYPAKDFIFYSADIHGNLIVKERTAAIRRLAELGESGIEVGTGSKTGNGAEFNVESGTGAHRLTVITTIDGCMDKLLPLDYIKQNIMTMTVGDEVNLTDYEKKLVKLGYERCAQAESSGQFAVRGGIIDIFPFTEETPYRIELWGDEIDSIRSYDAESQRSIENVEKVTIYPATELIFSAEDILAALRRIKADTEKQADTFTAQKRFTEAARIRNKYAELEERLMLDPEGVNGSMGVESYIGYMAKQTVSFLEYFDLDKTVYVVDEPGRVAERLRAVQYEFQESMSHRLEKGDILPEQTNVLYDGARIYSRLLKGRVLAMAVLDSKAEGLGQISRYDIGAKGISSYNNSFETLTSDIRRYKKEGYVTILVSSSRIRAERLAADLRDNDINAFFTDRYDRELLPGEVMTVYGNMAKGFEYPQIKLVFIAESDIFTQEKKKHKAKTKNYEGKAVSDFAELSIGDYVVHENHGMGIYRGIEKVVVDKVEKDYIKIEYSDGGNLYVLATQLDSIQKFSGPDGHKPKLNKLGTQEWSKTKAKVKTAVAQIAKELVELYAIRQNREGYHFSPDTVWQREFEDLFPYEETNDQLTAIAETKQDMESGRIMDRLLCGDVGFGKTEVAMRAAFKAVQDGKQVVYLVPTTILAQQHYNSFVQRMQSFGVRVELLSRFCTPAQVKNTLNDLKKGLVDIVIGTHRVLSKDVQFKDLGLLIIDEEQRFGVTHKEKIKQLKADLDVLTLSATPIPRTLHMSLVGIRDMSVLTEAPVDRMPIQTFVTEYDEELIREAIIRELSRGGQVYYVFNMVKGIEDVAAKISLLVPDANVAFAHGQMPERQLERIMFDFINGDIDVLVSTTIIETGLDIPNTNTIIIHDADRFGLSQLYQLRGRVGRSNRTAYAFLLYKRDRLLREEAEKRLSAIREFTELGSGFKIAMKDLEIRGAGNVLGAEQHGHMAAVGYDLYCKMLNEAVLTLRGFKKIEDEFETNVDIPVDAYIPASYIKSEAQKLDVYKRIAAIAAKDELVDMQDELTDRFGDMPRTAINLMRIAYIKSNAHSADIIEIKGNAERIVIRMFPQARVDVNKIPDFIMKYDGRVHFKVEAVPYFTYTPIKDELKSPEKYLLTVEELVTEIGGLKQEETLTV